MLKECWQMSNWQWRYEKQRSFGGPEHATAGRPPPQHHNVYDPKPKMATSCPSHSLESLPTSVGNSVPSYSAHTPNRNSILMEFHMKQHHVTESFSRLSCWFFFLYGSTTPL